MRAKPNWVAGIFALVWLAIIITPIYVMVRAGLESRTTYAAKGPIGLPSEFTIENFRYAFEVGFGKYLVNSLIVTILTVLIVLAVVPPLSYAIVRSRSERIRLVFKTMLVGLAIPAQVVVIPVVFVVQSIGLYDTLIGVALPTAAFLVPLATLILSTTMREISGELYEAMAVDGASPVRAFLQLVLPLSRGGIATIAVLSAMNAWNNYLLPLVLTRSDGVRVATLGLGAFQQEHSLNVPGLMAAIMLSIIPMLLAYIFARRALVQGLMGVGGK
jgi:xylobiose transport system permease protein